jgi:Transposase
MRGLPTTRARRPKATAHAEEGEHNLNERAVATRVVRCESTQIVKALARELRALPDYASSGHRGGVTPPHGKEKPGWSVSRRSSSVLAAAAGAQSSLTRRSAGAQIRPFDAFAKGIAQWHTELLAYFDEPTTNGYAEGVINKIKVIKRRAYGLPTFRRRVVIACG